MDNNNLNIPNNNANAQPVQQPIPTGVQQTVQQPATGVVQQPVQQPVQQTSGVQPASAVQPAGAVTPPTVAGPTVAPPTVAGPTVAPPSVGNNNLSFDEEDGKILKPFVEQPVEPQPTEPVPEVAPQPEVVAGAQPDGAPVNGGDAGIMENKKMEKVEIEYKPPSKFKIFFMVFMFVVILGCIIFMDQISMFINQINAPTEPVVKEEEVQNGTLSCGLETNDDRFDLIYAGEFSFTSRQLKYLNYTLTTKGDRVEDSAELDEMYNNCKALSTELNTNNLGVKVVCDLFDGTLRIDQTIDYSSFSVEAASKLFKQYGVDLPDFEANQNIGDIERQLKSSNYICTMESKSE